MKKEWVNTILKQPNHYLGKFIVHDDNEVYYTSTTLTEANQWKNEHKDQYSNLICMLLSKTFFARKFLSVRVRSLRKDVWVPQKRISFIKADGSKLETDILVDSGADATFLPYTVGVEIGLTKNKGDIVKTAFGVGSQIEYLEKAIDIEIDSKTIEIPVCWCLNLVIDDLLLGREGIYERYRVVFDQQREEVSFELFQNLGY